MNFLGKVVLFCLAMGLLRETVYLLIVGLALAWIYGFIVKPAETIGFLLLLTLAACIRAYPGWSLVGFLMLAVVAVGVAAGKTGESNP
ncbi:hypothetical protein A8B75_18770 [Sphingomonadales bacterium EhC05]|nr:hypothetical protein A8B75_18770 [Sphingomonadales bacterium EhC05]